MKRDALALSADVTHQTAACARYLWIISRFYHVQAAVQADGHEIKTLEGLQEEALEFVGFIADQGADQCGFCNPGFVMNTIALLRENQDPTDDEIRAFLAGNLCRCSGYEGQLRGIRNFLDSRKACADEKNSN